MLTERTQLKGHATDRVGRRRPGSIRFGSGRDPTSSRSRTIHQLDFHPAALPLSAPSQMNHIKLK